MKRVIFLGVLLIFSTVCKAQILNDSTQNSTKPKVQVKVNKVYDENGNVVRYDSTYSWSYSSQSTENKIDVDSLINRFMPYFHKHFSNSLNKSFSDPFFNLDDSNMMLDFFNNDHFFKQWQNQLFDFQHQIQQMDSLKRLFFKQYLHQNRLKNTDKPKAGIY